MWDGKLAFALIAAVLLAALAGRIVAAVYRRRVLELMSHGAPPSDASAAAPGVALHAPPQARRPARFAAGMAQNRRARARVAAAFVAISLAIGALQAGWSLGFVYTEGGFGPIKFAIMALAFGWVCVPALGLLWRWSWLRIAAVSLAYITAVGALVWLRSNAQQSLAGVALWLGGMLAPVLIAFGLAASGRARATGPYLLPLFLVLVGASVLGTDLLAHFTRGSVPPPWLEGSLATFGAWGTIALAALAPWVLMAWPAWYGARLLAASYQAGHFSEPIYLLAGYWLVALLIAAMSASHGIGPAALTVLVCGLALPAGLLLLRRRAQPPRPAPNLLVLRVFRRDAQVQALFDSVIERWRYSGTVSLIAGTDLALATLEPDELFAFLGGRLRERFVTGAADLDAQLAAADPRVDPDGRFRVAEFYCFDTTWMLALDALVARADVVLMDLRGLSAKNAGCLHELGALARAGHLRRIALLFDAHTDHAAATEAIGADADRFVWFDATRLNRASAEAVLALLLEPLS
jgi:hypothetical protein